MEATREIYRKQKGLSQTQQYYTVVEPDEIKEDSLRFIIKDKDGKITGIEVYLPWYYEGKIDLGKLDPELLNGIGFRIPTQSLASIEHIIIKGFLPKSMGDAIVVPSEITGKAGSDFDVDKIFWMMPMIIFCNLQRFMVTSLDLVRSVVAH